MLKDDKKTASSSKKQPQTFEFIFAERDTVRLNERTKNNGL